MGKSKVISDSAKTAEKKINQHLAPKPKAAGPKAAGPKAAGSKAVGSKAVGSKAVGSKAAGPKAAEPKAAEPKVVYVFDYDQQQRKTLAEKRRVTNDQIKNIVAEKFVRRIESSMYSRLANGNNIGLYSGINSVIFDTVISELKKDGFSISEQIEDSHELECFDINTFGPRGKGDGTKIIEIQIN